MSNSMLVPDNMVGNSFVTFAVLAGMQHWYEHIISNICVHGQLTKLQLHS